MNSNNQIAFSTNVKFNAFKDGKSLRLLCLNNNEKIYLKYALHQIIKILYKVISLYQMELQHYPTLYF